MNRSVNMFWERILSGRITRAQSNYPFVPSPAREMRCRKEEFFRMLPRMPGLAPEAEGQQGEERDTEPALGSSHINRGE